jgi:ClpP class serine protease
MKSQFISRVVNAQWDFGTQARTHFIVGDMVRRLIRDERPDETPWGEKLPKMHIDGAVAYIPISGVLMLNVPEWIKTLGFNVTDVNDIEDEVTQALNNPAVEILCEHHDSPGGESVAGQKLYDLTEAARRKKPVLSWSGDGQQICSASYNGAAPSTAIYLGKFCEAVCIGTYIVNLDDTGFWEQLGMKWEVFRSGEYKGMGIDALSETQRDYLKTIVADFGEIFRKGVLKYRTEVDRANMEGQSFRGIEAAQLGFAAGVARDRDEALKRFRKLL